MRTNIKKVKEGDECPHCKNGILELVRGTEPELPYTDDHLMCNKCDSTYCLDEGEK